MQITSILKICLGIMVASERSLAGPAYLTAPPEIWDEGLKSPGEFPLRLPNPVDCGSYYECSRTTAYLLHCPLALHFNPALQVCDHPSAANCVIASMHPTPPPSATTYGPVINTTASHAPVINTTASHAPVINTTTIHAPVNITTTHAPVNTTATYAPVNTTTTHAPVINTTATHAPVINTTTSHAPVINTTTTYAPVINTTTTHAPVINTTTSHAPVINTTTTHAPVINTTITYDPVNTTTTHAPVINTTTTHAPVINTTTTHAPVFKAASDPSFHTSSTTTTSTTNKPGIVTAPPEVAAQCPPYTLNRVAHIPNSDDCTTFYACHANGWAILQQCPPGQHFNPELKACDDPSTASCHPAK